MNARDTSPVADNGNDRGDAVPEAVRKSIEPPQYDGVVQPCPVEWQVEAITPPRVETHAVTAPPVRDTLLVTVASNCRAVNAKASPQNRAAAVVRSVRRNESSSKHIALIVACSLHVVKNILGDGCQTPSTLMSRLRRTIMPRLLRLQLSNMGKHSIHVLDCVAAGISRLCTPHVDVGTGACKGFFKQFFVGGCHGHSTNEE